jgi:hypothetical protein
MNNYGETTWLTIEDAKNGTIPESQSWFEGPFRICYNGEPQLTMFIKKFLGIPNKSYKKQSGEIVTIENKEDAYAALDRPKTLFSGNVNEIQNAISAFPNNKIKLLMGVKTVEGKQFQDFYSEMPISLGSTSYTSLEKNMLESKANGGYPNTEFVVAPLDVYTPSPSSLSPSTQSAPTTVNDGAFF